MAQVVMVPSRRRLNKIFFSVNSTETNSIFLELLISSSILRFLTLFIFLGFGVSAPLFVAVAVLFATPANAQVVSTGQTVNGETATPTPGGHDYIHFLADTVNPANGSVSINVEFPTPKGRGISLPYRSSYSSAGLYNLTETPLSLIVFQQSSHRADNLPQATWTESEYVPPPVQCNNDCNPPTFSQCNFATNFTFSDLSGTSHNLGIGVQAQDASQTGTMYTSVCGTGNTVPSTNGSGTSAVGDGKVSAFFVSPSTSVSLVANWNICDTCDPQAALPVGAFTVTDESGLTYFFDGNCTYNSADRVCTDLATNIEDRNGNEITASSSVYTDTLGRPLFVGTQSATTIGGISYPNGSCPGSCPTTTTVQYTPPSQFTFASGYNEVVDCPQNTPGSSMTVSSTYPAWGGLALPTVPQTQYTFYFGGFNPTDSSVENVYGLINQIIYPGGGWVKYIWKMSGTNGDDPENKYTEMSTFTGTGDNDKRQINGCYTRYGTPVLSQRIVSYDGVHIAQTQIFTYSTNWGETDSEWASNPTGWSSKSTTVQTTDNVLGKSFKTVYKYVPGFQPGASVPFTMSSAAPEIPVESTIQYYGWDGTLLRTVSKTWLDLFDLSEEDVTLDNGLTAKTTYSYTGSVCVNSCLTANLFPVRLTSKSEYDYNGTLLSTTTTNYQLFGLSPFNTAVPPLPSSIIISGTNGPIAETDYAYDGIATTSVVGVEQHDDANYGYSYNARGNLTTKTQKCISGTGCSANSVTTYTYDSTGQVLSMTDACGNGSCNDISGTSHVTNYSYQDQFTSGGSPPTFTDAYLTQVTYPQTNSSHIESFTYDYSSGQLTNSTDQNGQPTSYSYNDPLARLTQTKYPPGGGQTTISYNDNPYSLSANTPNITTTKEINSTANLTSTVAADGMGHSIRGMITSDPEGTDYTDTTYDGEGHVATVTNPYRSTGDPTYGITQHTYDALGRPTQTTDADGSTVTISYSGNCTTTKDEASKQRKSCTDALGRLTNVWEDPTGLNYETDYQYDALNNLLSVTQKGGSSQANWRTRTFTYDSLSRLLSAANPESGTINYSYDLNGNLVTKIDARGITTTMTYDALNRVLTKSYSDNTPTANFYYDTPPAPWASNETNTNGRLVEETTGITPEP